MDFDYAGQDVLTVSIAANQGEAIENNLLRGSVLGQKNADDDSIQQGVSFGLFRPGEADPILTTVAGENGWFSFENIPFGHYEVRSCPVWTAIPWMRLPMRWTSRRTAASLSLPSRMSGRRLKSQAGHHQ